MDVASKLINEIVASGNQSDAVFLQHFFKTGLGEYGEGDRFLGLRVPQTRKITNKYTNGLNIDDLETLLQNKWHEVRFAALVAMINQFKIADDKYQKQLFDLYIKQIGKGVNNWDLVDISCPRIVGAYLSNKSHDKLYKLAKEELWQKRVSIISTFYFLRHDDNPVDTYKIAEILVYEKHDLLQKAVGWALREMGKKDSQLLRQFLDRYAATMPRTALRYSLEKYNPGEKSKYMKLKAKL